MESKIHKVNENTANELIWTLEHNEIFTAGTSFKENEIKNKPRQTIIMPPKPYVFIEVDKNIILKRAIKSEEPPLAIG